MDKKRKFPVGGTGIKKMRYCRSAFLCVLLFGHFNPVKQLRSDIDLKVLISGSVAK